MLHYIKKVTPPENFLLQVVFRNGETKIFDAKPYLTGPVFEPLHNFFISSKCKPTPSPARSSGPMARIFAPTSCMHCPSHISKMHWLLQPQRLRIAD